MLLSSYPTLLSTLSICVFFSLDETFFSYYLCIYHQEPFFLEGSPIRSIVERLFNNNNELEKNLLLLLLLRIVILCLLATITIPYYPTCTTLSLSLNLLKIGETFFFISQFHNRCIVPIRVIYGYNAYRENLNFISLSLTHTPTKIILFVFLCAGGKYIYVTRWLSIQSKNSNLNLFLENNSEWVRVSERERVEIL